LSLCLAKWMYEGVSKSFRTSRLERELQMAQTSVTRCSCSAILWVSLVSFAAIILYASSQRVFTVVVVVYLVVTQSGNFWIHPRIPSRPHRFTPWVRASGTHWIGGWMGPRAGMDEVEKRNKSHHCPCWELNSWRPGRSLVPILTGLPRLLPDRIILDTVSYTPSELR